MFCKCADFCSSSWIDWNCSDTSIVVPQFGSRLLDLAVFLFFVSDKWKTCAMIFIMAVGGHIYLWISALTHSFCRFWHQMIFAWNCILLGWFVPDKTSAVSEMYAAEKWMVSICMKWSSFSLSAFSKICWSTPLITCHYELSYLGSWHGWSVLLFQYLVGVMQRMLSWLTGIEVASSWAEVSDHPCHKVGV